MVKKRRKAMNRMIMGLDVELESGSTILFAFIPGHC